MKMSCATSRWKWWRFPQGMLFCCLVPGLVGCTASWRAPVESRGREPVRVQAAPRPALPASYYRVQPGDTLYGIAWQRGVDYRLVAAWNGIRPPYRIYTGQTLRLKAPPVPRRPPLSTAPPRPVAVTPARRQPPAVAARPKAVPETVAAPKPAPPRPATPKPAVSKPAVSKPAVSKPAVSKPAPPPAAPPPERARQLAWRWPAQGGLLARFDASDPTGKGIKIGGRRGDAVRAAEAGKVVYSGSGLIGYGRLIIVKHNDNFLSAYGHNRKMLVKEGDQVTKGQKIAEMGAASNGDPVLHFEIRRDGKPVDPLRLLPRR